MTQSYVLQVHTGKEWAVAWELHRMGLDAMAPEEHQTIRKRGEWRLQTRALFPGYVFVECSLSDDLYHQLRRKPHVVQWLGTPPQPLTPDETRRIHWLRDCGANIKLHCPLGGRAAICSGPFKGLEGDIIRINRRRGRVRLRLEMCGHPFEVSLSYTQVTTNP